MPQTYTIEQGLSHEETIKVRNLNRLVDLENGVIRYRGIHFADSNTLSRRDRLHILPGLFDPNEVTSENRLYINMHNPRAKVPEYIDSVFYYKDSGALGESLITKGNKFVLVLARGIFKYRVGDFVNPLVYEYSIDRERKDVLLFFPTDRTLSLYFEKKTYDEFLF